MYLAACHLPYQPCLHRAEKKPSCFSLLSGAFHIVQYPLQLCTAEIGIYKESGLFPDGIAAALCLEFTAKVCCPPALPYYGVIYGHSSFFIPDYGRLTLVGYPYGLYIFICKPHFQQSFLSDSHLCRPDLHWIMLYPAFFGKYLRKFFLSQADYIFFFIINYAS